MLGRPLSVTWNDAPDAFLARSRQERDSLVVRCLLALRLLRMGATLTEAATALGVSYRGLQKWVRWYRTGGLDAVCAHPRGGLRVPSPPLLSIEQEAAVVAEATTNGFITQPMARAWLVREHAVTRSSGQLAGLFRQLRLRRKKAGGRVLKLFALEDAVVRIDPVAALPQARDRDLGGRPAQFTGKEVHLAGDLEIARGMAQSVTLAPSNRPVPPFTTGVLNPR